MILQFEPNPQLQEALFATQQSEIDRLLTEHTSMKAELVSTKARCLTLTAP